MKCRWVEWNPSSNEKDTTGACWHGDVDLEVVPRWHVYAYLCILLGCFGDVLQSSMDDGDPHDVDMESKDNGALDIYEDAPVIAYLQIGEILIGLTPKEKDCVVHRTKRFKWKGNFLLRMWVDGQVKVVPHLERRESNCKFNNLFLGVWCVTNFEHPSMYLHFTYSLYQLWGLGIHGVWILPAH